jgi:hypothetical protein
MIAAVYPRAVFCLVLALAILCASPPAARGDDDKQLWPELDVYYRLNPSARLFFLIAPVSEVTNGQRSDITDTQLGANVDIGLFPILRAHERPALYDNHRMTFLRFRTGVRYLTVDGDDAKDEWRIVAELTPRAHLPQGLLLAFRNRFDLRWVDDVYSWRYRPRLWLEREFKVGKEMALVPYVSAELFRDSRSNTWNRTRYQVGTAVSVTPWFAPEIYWAHQLDDASDGDTVTDALGIVAAFFF